jgi:hypothetical protein
MLSSDEIENHYIAIATCLLYIETRLTDRQVWAKKTCTQIDCAN